jgi:redox-sensitive bicupin YhaK (pirin superfamily)
MSAGAGLRHEEYNVGEEEVNFLQIWIQPKIQNILPRYQSRYFARETRYNQLQTIVSHEEGAGHCWINQNARLSMGWFDAGKKVVYDLQKHNSCVFLFVISGSLQVEQTLLAQRDAIGIWDTELLEFTCVTEAEFLLIETPVNQK